MSLWHLIEPLSRADFLAQHWHRSPLFHPGLNRGLHSFLPRADDLDRLLNAAAPNASEFDFYAAGKAVQQSEYAGPGNYVLLNRLLGLYAKGGTIHVSNLQKYAAALGHFCKDVQSELMVDCEADLWLTRENDFAPYLHFDRYDIFVLQIHGRKRWRLFEPLALPAGRVSAALSWDQVGEPLIDVVVEPGDLIYIPPYTPHVVTTVESHSAHVGIGLHPLSWREVLEFALEESRHIPTALDEFVSLDFMQAMAIDPRGAIDTALQLAHRALAGIQEARIQDRVFDHYLTNVTHANDGHLVQQILGSQAPVVQADTPLRTREHTPGRAFISDDRAVLAYAGGGTITGPVSYLPSMLFMLGSAGQPFTAAGLDTALDIEARIALLQRAVDAGLCRRV